MKQRRYDIDGLVQGLVKSREIHVPGSKVVAVKSGYCDTYGQIRSESKYGISVDVLEDESADRADHKRYQHGDHDVLCAKEKSGSCHKINISHSHGFFVSRKGDYEQRNADDECAKYKRREGHRTTSLAEQEFRYGENAYKYHHPGVDELSVPIHEEYHYQRRGHQRDERSVKRRYNHIKAKEYPQIADAVEQLDHRVSGSYLSAAGVAFSSQQAPADNGYQISLSDGCTAGHAVGVAFYQALTQRETVYADIQETSDAYAEEKHEYIHECGKQYFVVHF